LAACPSLIQLLLEFAPSSTSVGGAPSRYSSPPIFCRETPGPLLGLRAPRRSLAAGLTLRPRGARPASGTSAHTAGQHAAQIVPTTKRCAFVLPAAALTHPSDFGAVLRSMSAAPEAVRMTDLSVSDPCLTSNEESSIHNDSSAAVWTSGKPFRRAEKGRPMARTCIFRASAALTQCC